MQVEFYVAFSIAGSNSFIRARKQLDLPSRPSYNENITITGIKFTVSKPRQRISQNNGVKLLASDLDDSYRAKKPEVALEFFKKLQGLGWSLLDEQAFIRKHNIQPVTTPAPAVPQPESVNVTEPVTPVVETLPEVAEEPKIIAETENHVDVAMQTQENTASANVPNMQNLGKAQQEMLDLLKQAGLPVALAVVQSNYNAQGYRARQAPSDIKRVLQGLADRYIITFDGTTVTALHA